MENFSYHVPFYLVTGGIATSGHSSDLTAGKVGLYDRNTWSVATGIGNGVEFFFAQGPTGGLDWYGKRVTESHKSPFFYGSDIEDMYLSKPQRIRNEEWVIGYNGSPSSVGLKYVKGEALRFKIYLHGGPTYRFYNGPKEYVISYTPGVECLVPCNGDDCPDLVVDCELATKAIVNQINNHPELPKFAIHAKYVSSTYAPAVATMVKWCLTVCDNGDPLALNAVRSQVPAEYDVVRTARTGSLSTYEFCKFDDGITPTAFQQSGSILQAVCAGDPVPAGAFLVGAKDVYIVRRPLNGSETLTTAALRDTYANTVWTAYATAGSITTSTSTTSTTTAAGSLVNPDATFLGQDGAVAILKLKFAAGSTVNPLLADTIELISTEPAVYVFAAPASIAWTECGEGIRSSRTLRIKNINRPDCDADGDRLTDISAAIAGVVGIRLDTLTLEEGDACKDDYTVQQWSVDCLDEACMTSNATFHYDTLPSFENEAWEEVPPVIAEDDERKCGIRITAGFIDKQFGNCSFNPDDYYETEPVKMELSLLGEDWDNCDYASRPTVSQSQIGQIARQSGEYVVRELVMKTDAYLKHVDQFSLDNRMREAFDMNLLNSVDRTAFYNLYYVRFFASYGNAMFRKPSVQERFTAVFAFKEGDPAAQLFETQVIDVLTAKSGKHLHIHEANIGGSSGMQGIGA